MKPLLLFLLVLLQSFFPSSRMDGKKDLKLAIKELNASREAFLEATRGLSEPQLNFRAAPERWSIRDCMEHITLSETMLQGWLQACLAEKADRTKRDSVHISDAAILQGVQDRSKRFDAIDPLRPGNKFASAQAATDSFVSARGRLIQSLKKTQPDLRLHYMQHPVFGWIDTYQGILFISGHTRRHILQMAEIKSSPGFPQ